jgi:hypothetical protein
MARGSWQELSPWKRRALTIPPDSPQAWIRLAVWELWMGMLLCLFVGLGASLIASSPDQIVRAYDFSRCYATPPVVLPCERVAYRVGLLNAAFTSLFGGMLIGAAAWVMWELWSAVAPKPIADDFLRLLNDSFARRWMNPLTWPWARMSWAYGFTTVGVALTAGAAVVVSLVLLSWSEGRAPTVHVETSETFRLGQ